MLRYCVHDKTVILPMQTSVMFSLILIPFFWENIPLITELNFDELNSHKPSINSSLN